MKRNIYKNQAINVKSVCKELLLFIFLVLFYQSVNAQTVPCDSLVANSVTICYGATATLSASGVSSYSWSTGSQYDTILISPPYSSSSLIYTLTGSTPSLGCESTVTVEVHIFYAPSFATLTINPPNGIICAGDSATLTINGTVDSYTWSSGTWSTTGTNSIVVSPAVTTMYVISVELNSCRNGGTAIIGVNELPEIIALINPYEMTICAGETVTLIAVGAYTRIWSTDTQTWSVNSNSFTVTTPTIPFNTYTTITYSVIGVDEYDEYTRCVSSPKTVSVALYGCYDPEMGVTNNSNDINLSIFPNPVAEILTIECEMMNRETEIKIIDLLGREMLNKKMKNGKSEIDVSSLPKGIYFIKVGNHTKKFMKE